MQVQDNAYRQCMHGLQAKHFLCLKFVLFLLMKFKLILTKIIIILKYNFFFLKYKII